MPKLLKITSIFLLLVLLLIVGVFITVVESTPLVVASSSEQVDQAESVKLLMRQVRGSVRHRTKKQRIVIEEKQLNSLVGVAQRANNDIQGSINISSSHTSIIGSYKLPKAFLGQYLNFDIGLLPGPGISISHVRIGSINISGHFALGTVVKMANWYTKSDIATQFLQQVEHVSMSEHRMVLSMLPLDKFLRELNLVKQGLGGSGDDELRIRTAYYLKQLSSLNVSLRKAPQSLAQYIGPLFAWAKMRSYAEPAAQENKAAIMALAIYAGHHRFANLVGDVQPFPGKVVLPAAKPVLALRHDLNQHFIFSAAIKILSEQGLSIAIGEFKELMDRSKGGSGYSFVDLAADFAGVKFAEVATDPETASWLQEKLANNLNERAFFPATNGLPEGLDKAEFTRQFQQVDSPKYKQMVHEIQRRIAELPIHKY